MPRIEKMRVTNIKLDNENKLMSDQTWDFKANNTLFLLQNGGGKSSVINLTMQAIKPNGFGNIKYKNKKLVNYATSGRTINVALEWQLDDEMAPNIIIGVCYKNQGYSSKGESEESSHMEDYFTYIVDTGMEGIQSIEDLPFIDGKQVLDYKEIHAQMKAIPNVSRYSKYEQKKYEEHLAELHIFVNEWEMMAKINLEEAGVAKYFSDMEKSQQVLERFFVPAIIKSIYSTNEEVDSPLNLFKQYKDVILDLPRIDQMLSALSAITNQANAILDNIDSHNKAFEELQNARQELYRAFKNISFSNDVVTQKLQATEESLLQIEKSMKELEWKIKSFERHQLVKKLEETKTQEETVEYQVEEVEEVVEVLTLKIREQMAANKVVQMNKVGKEIEKEEAALKVAQMDFEEKSKQHAQATDKLNHIYSKLYADNEALIELERRNNEKLYQERAELQSGLKEVEVKEKELTRRQQKSESKMEMYQEELKEMMVLLKDYEGIGLEQKVEKVKSDVEKIKKSQTELAVKRQEIQQQKTDISLALLKNENESQRYTNELTELNKNFEEFTDREGTIKFSMVRRLADNLNKYIEQYGDNMLVAPNAVQMFIKDKMEQVTEGIQKRKSLIQKLSVKLNMIETKGYTVLKEVEEVAEYLEMRSVDVMIGADWLVRKELSVEEKQNIVKKHPLLSVSIVIEAGQMASIEKLMQNYKKDEITSPIFFIEKSSLGNGDVKNNPYVIEPGTFIYHQYDNKYTVAEWDAFKEELVSDKRKLQNEITDLNVTLAELEEIQHQFKSFSEKYTVNSRQEFTEKISTMKSTIVKLTDERDTLEHTKNQIDTTENSMNGELVALGEQLSVQSDVLHSAVKFQNRYKNIREEMFLLDEIKSDLSKLQKEVATFKKSIEEKLQQENASKDQLGKFKMNLNNLHTDAGYVNMSIVPYGDDVNTDEYTSVKQLVYELNKTHSNEKEQLDNIGKLLLKYKEEYARLEGEILSLGFNVEYFDNNSVIFNELTLKALENENNEATVKLKAKQGELAKLQLEIATTEAKIAQEDKGFKNAYKPFAFEYGESATNEMEHYQLKLNQSKEQQIDTIAEVKRLNVVKRELEAGLDKLSDLQTVFIRKDDGEPNKELSDVEDIKQLVREVRQSYDRTNKEQDKTRTAVNRSIQVIVNIARDKGNSRVVATVEKIQNEALKDEGNLMGVYDKFVRLIEVENSQRGSKESKLKNIEEATGRLIESFYSYSSNIYNFIKELPRHSNVTIGNETFKLFDIKWDKKTENEAKEEIKYYLEKILIPRVSDMKKDGEIDSTIDSYLKKELTPYKITSLVASPGKFKIKVLKPREKELNLNRSYYDWEERSKDWSGGEKHASSIALFISVNTFIRHKQTNMIAPPSILIADNPFATASSEHVVAPMMEICRATNTQLISFTDHRKKEIEVEFDTVLNNKYIELGGRKVLYTKMTSKDTKEVNLLSSGKQVKFDI